MMGRNKAYVPGAEFPWQYKYEHMAVTTDCVIFTYEDWKLKVLLVRRGGDPFKGEWAFPGGFLHMDETAEEGALRELREETALTPSAIGQLGVFSDVDRDPRERVITIAWYALVKPSEVVGGDDAAEAAWFPVDDLPSLAFDHRKIFSAAMERLRRDIHFQPVGFDLLDDEFTIPDLQRLYETILGVKFDRRNFQRKLMSTGILEEADDGAPFCEEYESVECSAPARMEEVALPCPEPVEIPRTTCPEGAPRRTKGRPGRIGSLFRLNRKRYDEMKEEGGKMEF
jgi:8-oxo-dGTP diphosphatase